MNKKTLLTIPFIFILSTACLSFASEKSAEINKTWTTASRSQLTVHVDFEVKNMGGGARGTLISYFYSSDREPLPAYYFGMSTIDGYVATYKDFRAPGRFARYNNYELKVPFRNLMTTKKKRKRRLYKVCVISNYGEFLDCSKKKRVN